MLKLLFFNFAGSLYPYTLRDIHLYSSVHWVDFILFTTRVMTYSKTLSDWLIILGFKYFHVLNWFKTQEETKNAIKSLIKFILGFDAITTQQPRSFSYSRVLLWKFFRAFSIYAHCSRRSTKPPINELRATNGSLPSVRAEWLCGFCDGESTFYINLSGGRVVLSFIIKQAAVSASSLFAIQDYFGEGSIRWDDANLQYLRFEIGSTRAITEKLIPFFEKYPLLTSKQLNFLDFKKVAELVNTNKHLTPEGFQEIQSIKSRMNSKRSYEEKEAYMASRKAEISITPGWLSGFIDGEGHLGVYLSDKPRLRCEPKFSISQNSHDVAILEAIANYLGTQNKIVPNTGPGSTVSQLSIYDFDTLFNKIVVILDQNPLITAKQNDFIKWRTVLSMISRKEHLGVEGFSRISKILKSGAPEE